MCATRNRSIVVESDVLLEAMPVHNGRQHPCNPLHLYRRCVEAQKVLRHDNISSQKKFSGVGITLARKVFLKPFEGAGVFSGWLHFGNHLHFTVPVLSVLTAL